VFAISAMVLTRMAKPLLRQMGSLVLVFEEIYRSCVAAAAALLLYMWEELCVGSPLLCELR
jgi:hypothetical protein